MFDKVLDTPLSLQISLDFLHLNLLVPGVH